MNTGGIFDQKLENIKRNQTEGYKKEMKTTLQK